MAKKTVSFSLEEDIIQAIERYQKEKKLSSKSAALERIILLYTMSTNGNAPANENVMDAVKDKSELDKSISDMYSNMPD